MGYEPAVIEVGMGKVGIMKRYLVALIVLLVPCLGGQGQCRTWVVELDGSGDFTVIQDAVDAAADGDTIFIGPGHHAQMHQVNIPGTGFNPLVTASWSDDRALTFVGSGPEQSLLGPDEWDGGLQSIYGILNLGSGLLVVQDLAIQNGYHGITVLGGIVSNNCHFFGGFGGVYNEDGPVAMTGCRFTGGDPYERYNGVVSWNGDSMTIEDSTFENSRFYADGCADVQVRRCTFDGQVGSYYNSNGVFENNVAHSVSTLSLNITYGSQVLVRNNEISGDARAMYLVGYPTDVEITGNVITGGYATVFEVHGYARLHGSGNDIYCGGEWAVWTSGYSGTDTMVLDLRNNYWGTTSAEQVSGWILDYNDDHDIHSQVLYLPMASGPLPTESTTLGGLKAMFR